MVILFNYEEAKKRVELPIHEVISKYRIPPPIILKEHESIEHLINTLFRYGRECVLVSDNRGKVTGIITLFDLLKLFIEHPRSRLILRHPRLRPENERSPISTVMSPNPIKIGKDLKLRDVLELMVRYGVSHVVVIEPKTKEPIAVLSKRIILRELLGVEILRDLTTAV